MNVVYDEGNGHRFKAGTTTYTAPELAGVLEAAVDNLDDVKKRSMCVPNRRVLPAF